MPLKLNCVHPKFTPKTGSTRFTWTPPPARKISALKIEIRDRKKVLVLEKNISAPTHQFFEWNGVDEKAAPVKAANGSIVKQFVDSLRAPFTFELVIQTVEAKKPLAPPSGMSTSESSQILPCGPPPKKPIQSKKPAPPKVSETARCKVTVG